MNLTTHNSSSSRATRTDAGLAEETLRMIAQLPAPKGLEDRVLAGLDSAPRRGRLLEWPPALQPGNGWMRGVAAAAIVFVVAGGGWSIYTRVLPTQPSNAVVMPRAGAGGGFSNAGAMRTPQTLDGPVVAEPVKKPSVAAKAAEEKTPAKAAPTAKAKKGVAAAAPDVPAVR